MQLEMARNRKRGKVPGMRDSRARMVDNVFAKSPRPAAPAEEPDDLDLPNGEMPYKAYSRPAEKPVYTLHCCLGKDGYRSFQYVHLDSESKFEFGPSQIIRIRFAGSRTTQLTLRGRNLNLLFDYLHQHRVRWIMVADRDFAADVEAVITELKIEYVD